MEDNITNLQGLLSNLRSLWDGVRAMHTPEDCSESGEVDTTGSNSTQYPHPRVCDLIADCNFTCIEISRVISLLAIQRSADSKDNHAMLKKQQAFREELSDRVTELREEYKSQLEDLSQQLQREREAHSNTKAINNFYLALHSKRENSLRQEIEERKEQVKQLHEDVHCLRRKVKDTEELKKKLFRPDDCKEWVLQWFSKSTISKVTGSLLEKRYRSAMKDLDKVIAQMDALATESDLLNQHAELLQYICTTLFNLDYDVAFPPSHTVSENRGLVNIRMGPSQPVGIFNS